MRSFPSRPAQAGFTLIEVLAATMILSLLGLCVVRIGAVYGRMTGDLKLRQKAVFVIDGEMERLAALYNTTSFGTITLPQLAGYPALGAIPMSTTRSGYAQANPLTPFVTSSPTAFATADTYVWSPGAGTTANYVWLDRDHNIMSRLSWIACPVNATTVSTCWGGTAGKAGSTTYTCFDPAGLGTGANCQLLTLVLDYPFYFRGGGAVAASTLSTLTLNTIVGRRR